MLKKIMVTISIILGAYILVCGLLFLLQEKLIFFPQKLKKNHNFSFKQEFEEIYIATEDQKVLHGLLFKADSSKGLIFYLHGNAGSLDAWGIVADTYTPLQYDVFLLDYRGYGKSEGAIESEAQLFQDVEHVYKEMLKLYTEDKVVVLGYSLGTGLAAKLASTNNPKLLILQAPYYSLTDIVKHTFPFVPPFLLRYKLNTYKYISDCDMPIVLFHGNEDEVIPFSQSMKLKPLLKDSDKLIIFNRQGHNGMTFREDYVEAIGEVLSRNR
jgi:uncharacterized protein